MCEGGGAHALRIEEIFISFLPPLLLKVISDFPSMKRNKTSTVEGALSVNQCYCQKFLAHDKSWLRINLEPSKMVINSYSSIHFHCISKYRIESFHILLFRANTAWMTPCDAMLSQHAQRLHA